MRNRIWAGLGLAALGAASFATPALAAQPADWQLGLQKPATPLMTQLTNMHDFVLMPIITVITIFVLALLVWVMIRYNSRSNPTPAKFTHNLGIEIAWTVVPVLILAIIAIPSFRLLYKQDIIPEADLTIKAIGSSWYWSYEYPDHGDIALTSLLLPEEEARSEGKPWLLATDENVVVPVGAVVRVQVTSTDVLHSWAVPAFGIKMDAVPGRLNETWFQAEREGMFYGQCSELCGKDHAYMPIAVEVVSQEKFDEWVQSQTAANDTLGDETDVALRATQN